MTRVVNIHRREEYDVYRGSGTGRTSYERGRWGNPFAIGRDGTCEEVLAKYREYILGRSDLLAQLDSLRGKRLDQRMIGATCCSGIGAPEAAAPDIDWIWAAENNPFASRVYAAHYDTPNLGDMNASDFVERAMAYGPLDLLVAGTPCQAFSIAGARKSLDDERGNLTLRFVEVCDAIDPGIILWENVPGVLSTRDNAFGCFLGWLAGADTAIEPVPYDRSSPYWRYDSRGKRWVCRWPDAGVVAGPKRRIAWRVLDAQHFRLAQRRRRVFVVAASARTSRVDPAAVLLEREGLRRNTAARRKAREEVAGCLDGGAGERDWCNDTDRMTFVSMSLNGKGGSGRMDGESETFVTAFSSKDHGADAGPLAPTLRAMPHDRSHANGGGQVAVAFDMAQITSAANGSRVEAGQPAPPVVAGGRLHVIARPQSVRRLTPVECERLQGFPDGYTAIGGAADGPRYKAIGNSMAMPVMAWLLGRIRAAGADGRAV